MGKMDKKLYASKQKWEVRYLLKKYSWMIPQDVILSIAKKVGRSRVKLYQSLLEWVAKNRS